MLIWPTCCTGPLPEKFSDRREPNALDGYRPTHFRGFCGEVGTPLCGYVFTDGALEREKLAGRQQTIAG